MKLDGKIAIVTGAGQGMGRGIAEKLAQQGATVFVTSLLAINAEETAEIIRAKGGKAASGSCDISKVSDIKKMFDECEATLGRADILVANAGIAPMMPISEITEEAFDKAYNTNAKGTLFCLKEAGNRLNEGGHIVVISSSSTTYPVPGMVVYSSSKSAIQLMTVVAAQEFGPRKITVNCVQPGLTITPAMDGTQSPEFMDMVINRTAANRLGVPEDVAEIVAFYCSDESYWVTGQTILANGGCFS